MSDPLSNREIEDVLISIRRLVAQEGGRSSETTRLVLTEAQRVLDQAVQAQDRVATSPDAAPDSSPLAPEISDRAADAAGGEAPLTRPSRGEGMPSPDFSQLEATIAELEAAVSTTGNTWESEAETSAPVASNVTELYGRLSFSRRPSEAEQPGLPETADTQSPDAGSDTPARAENHGDPAASVVSDLIRASDPQPLPTAAEPDPAPAATALDAARPDIEAPEVADDPDDADQQAQPMPPVLEDDTDTRHETRHDASFDPEDTFLDEEMLRALIAQMVRDELHGQLGERITQQVRKLVRAEIAKALADRTVF